jgi:hypothetical protein
MMALLPVAFLLAPAQPQLPLNDILSRIAEEAEMFVRVAPQTLAEETLEQKALRPPPRFRPLASQPPKPRYQTREIISEYSYSSLKESPGVMHEFRQVISIDGRKINTPEKARHALSLGLRSEDDRLRKRMLEEFQKHGLIGAAVDFGQILLLFTKRRMNDYEFTVTGSERVGADATLVLYYRQIAGPDSFLVFEGAKSVHERLTGQVWVRQADGLPLRISMRSVWKEGQHVVRHEASIEYTPAPFGIVVPAAVKHSEYWDNLLRVENVFRYSPFKKFRAASIMKFETVPPPESK